MVAAGEFVLPNLDPLGVFQVTPPPEAAELQQLTVECWHHFFGVCLIIPPIQDGGIFGFSEFVTAIALLVIVYTVTDTRYRFRISVAPIPIARLTFVLSIIIGVGTLMADVWFTQRFPVPRVLASRAIWQAVFGIMFLTMVMAWIWFAFIAPPIFGKSNYKKFTRSLYLYLVRGSVSELPAIAAELVSSSDAIVKFASQIPYRTDPGPPSGQVEPGVSSYAHDLLLLIGNRKLCRAIVAESPATAIAIFSAMSRQKKYHLPLTQFASNITTEALDNKDSAIYHEDAGYYSGLIGYLKPFSKALFGDYKLVEALASEGNSPLDLNHRARLAWEAPQVTAYSSAVLITFEAYLDGGNWGSHSYALFRAMGSVRDASRDIYKLDGDASAYHESDIYRRLNAVLHFFKEVLSILDTRETTFRTTLRRRGEKQVFDEDMYDLIAELMFEIIFDAAAVTSPVDTCWSIQHNLVWNTFFNFRDGPSSEIVQFKLRRLLYEAIIELDEFVNYKGARILGYCLNVMGLKVRAKHGYGSEEYALHKAVLNWTTKNFLTLNDRLPDVMSASLIGSITLDEQDGRLVKTYAKNLNPEAPKDYLELEPVRKTP